jgi:Uma2 family endonuclease
MSTIVSMSDVEQQSLLTAEEFLDWLKPGVHADLIDGEIVTHAPVNLRHADLLNFVDLLLRSFIEARKLGKLYREVVAVRLSVLQVYLPDLAFFTNEQVSQLKPTQAPIAPTLVVEALSPGTASNDVGDKFAAYELHGVLEYWVIDPDHLAHRFYRRQGEVLAEFAAGEETIRSVTVPGFLLKRSWLNPEKLPDAKVCLSEIL